MSYSYCGERMGIGFFSIYRQNEETCKCEKFDAHKNEWIGCVEALDAFNGEIHTSSISEEEALKTAAMWVENVRKSAENDGKKA